MIEAVVIVVAVLVVLGVIAAGLSVRVVQQFEQGIKDIHFDFDSADVRDEDRAILSTDAEWLKAHPDVLIILEGLADDRGDILYNVVLSGARAAVTRDALVQLGVPASQIAFSTVLVMLFAIC